MMLADTLAIFLVIVGLLIAFPALWLLCLALWPSAVKACAERNQGGMLKSFFVGLPIVIIMIVLTGVLGKLPGPVGQLSPLLALGVLFLYASVGVSGLATMVAARLPSAADTPGSWTATLRGSVILVLSYLFPILGWFLILPASLVIGCGTLTRVLLTSRKRVGASLAAAQSTAQPTAQSTAQPAGQSAEQPAQTVQTAEHIGAS